MDTTVDITYCRNPAEDASDPLLDATPPPFTAYCGARYTGCAGLLAEAPCKDVATFRKDRFGLRAIEVRGMARLHRARQSVWPRLESPSSVPPNGPELDRPARRL